MTVLTRLVSAVLFVVWFAGCSGAQWVHPTKPKDMFAQDYNKCQADALRDPKLQQGIQLLILEATERCVRKQGWQLVEPE
ncbi:hypothetical protein FBQ96_09130 [Nitrospirales bacterium NOB]|nr:hypothetical protein [Nitrospirales bacterium NOB]MEB2338636.1 hypothetical protein [Nitrospirales bacterium]QOJ33618.1 MAG: hypothetical protein HRU82_01040 [Nitrospira sp.]